LFESGLTKFYCTYNLLTIIRTAGKMFICGNLCHMYTYWYCFTKVLMLNINYMTTVCTTTLKFA